MPNVTVLIPVLNAEATLMQTLDSLVAQTYRDFEVMLVNNGSSDATSAIAHSYRYRIPLTILNLEKNLGVAGALNLGLAQISSPLIARLDADDLALPTRLEKQVAFLDAHPQIDICGSALEVFFDDGSKPSMAVQKPLDDAAIKTTLIQSTAMSHPATLIRKSFFDDVGVYDPRLDFAEDYDLWCRGALLGKRYANLPEVLTKYRIHANQVSQQKVQLQFQRDLTVKRKYISALLGAEQTGYLAEFFSMVAQFAGMDATMTVITDCFPRLLKLGQRVADPQLFADIVTSSINRHLRRLQ